MSSVSYRPDIDGLRALAILPVVLFHLDVSAVRGGFTGVDVFFVISGYLITAVLLRDIEGNTFSLVRFYERRVRRLFPALFTMLAVCSCLAAVVLLPKDLDDYFQSVVATALFIANLLFRKSDGYFEPRAEAEPLLHAWSLAVEEQFYIFFPLCLWLLMRVASKRTRALVLLAIALASLVMTQLILDGHGSPKTAFYSAPCRAWELLVGSLLALGVLPALKSSGLRVAVAVGGAVAIVYGVVMLSPQSVFPGFAALYPCLGAAALIHAHASGATPISRLLEWRPSIFIGQISYSLYLWHWPLIVFAKYVLVRDLDAFEKIVIGAVSVVLSTLSWHFVEQPVRTGRWKGLAPRELFVGAGAAIASFVVIGALGHRAGGFPSRLDPKIVELAAVQQGPWRTDCSRATPQQVVNGKLCRVGEDVPADLLLWGDSHVIALLPALEQAAKAAGRSALVASQPGCPPLLGTSRHDVQHKHACPRFNEAVARLAEESSHLSTVVLIARWGWYSQTEPFNAEDRGPSLSADGPVGNPREFGVGLKRTFEQLRELGKQVLVITQVPELRYVPPSALARARLFGSELPPNVTVSEHDIYQRVARETMSNLSKQYPVRVVDVAETFRRGSVFVVETEGTVLYRDASHLSAEGALLVVSRLQGLFDRLSPRN